VQLEQEQELQLPEQQLHSQGDMLDGWVGIWNETTEDLERLCLEDVQMFVWMEKKRDRLGG
jgi:hypothetical protein